MLHVSNWSYLYLAIYRLLSTPGVARDAYLHWRDLPFAMKYFLKYTLCFLMVIRIKKHLLELTQTEIFTLGDICHLNLSGFGNIVTIGK